MSSTKTSTPTCDQEEDWVQELSTALCVATSDAKSMDFMAFGHCQDFEKAPGKVAIWEGLG